MSANPILATMQSENVAHLHPFSMVFPNKDASYQAAKRALDIFASGLALLLLAPVFLIIGIAIKLTDPGPIFYFQTRVGKKGKTFRFPKFRSMVMNADKIREQLEKQNQHGSEGVTFKMKRDPRITAVGRILRRFSLDELPQLWCVLTGELSLVGPRPALPSEVARYTPRDRSRLAVKPGLTCIWQVSGRSELPFEKQVELDREYIRKQSLALDLKLLLKTVPAVVSGRGAY